MPGYGVRSRTLDICTYMSSNTSCKGFKKLTKLMFLPAKKVLHLPTKKKGKRREVVVCHDINQDHADTKCIN